MVISGSLCDSWNMSPCPPSCLPFVTALTQAVSLPQGGPGDSFCCGSLLLPRPVGPAGFSQRGTFKHCFSFEDQMLTPLVAQNNRCFPSYLSGGQSWKSRCLEGSASS